MKKITSVMLIDDNKIDNFINRKILEIYGLTDIITFKNTNAALSYLKETSIKYQLILIDVYLPVMDGFEFIDKFYELELHKTQGNICILSASSDPFHRELSTKKNVRFIEKPLTIEKLLENKDT